MMRRASLVLALLLWTSAVQAQTSEYCGPLGCAPGAQVFDFLPTGSPVTLSTAAIAANTMRCITFTKHGTLLNAREIVSALVSTLGNCAVCLYPDSDTGALIAPRIAGAIAPALDCTDGATANQTGLDPFNLYDGQALRLCWTSDNASTTWSAIGISASAFINAQRTQNGTAATATVGGACGATTGALGSPVSTAPIAVMVAQ